VWSYYRLVSSNSQNVIDCNSIDFVKGMIRKLPSGRYTVVKISALPRPARSTVKRLGAIVKLDDGELIEELDAWES
jgi:hypothetical protein